MIELIEMAEKHNTLITINYSAINRQRDGSDRGVWRWKQGVGIWSSV